MTSQWLQATEAGLHRCWWPGEDVQYIAYHDSEWGRPVQDDQRLFEKLCLEGFQAGLSWLTILRKRENFRAAFDRFDIEIIATYPDTARERLLADSGIVRNRAKIEATLANARAVARLLEAEGPGAFDRLVWSFAPQTSRVRPLRLADVPAMSPESRAMARELKRRGLSFVGPTTMYAAMQAMGVVDDHLAGCHLLAGS